MKTEEITKRIEEIENELKDLRSELSEKDKSVDLSNLKLIFNPFLNVKMFNEYKNKSFYLSDLFNWEMKNDSNGDLCLIPTKK